MGRCSTVGTSGVGFGVAVARSESSSAATSSGCASSLGELAEAGASPRGSASWAEPRAGERMPTRSGGQQHAAARGGERTSDAEQHVVRGQDPSPRSAHPLGRDQGSARLGRPGARPLPRARSSRCSAARTPGADVRLGSAPSLKSAPLTGRRLDVVAKAGFSLHEAGLVSLVELRVHAPREGVEREARAPPPAPPSRPARRR